MKFTVTADSSNPDTSKLLTVGTNNEYTITDTDELKYAITVNVPSFNKAGVYKYDIKEVEGNTAGVTYDKDKTIKVVILVEYDNDSETKKLVIGNEKAEGINYWIEADGSGNKVDTFNNDYNTDGFSVAKNVSGNMANVTDEFSITVTLSIPSGKSIVAGTPYTVGGVDATWDADENGNAVATMTHTLSLSEADEATAFANLPEGVVVTVVENQKDADGNDIMNGYTLDGYTIDNAEKVSTSAEIVVGTNKSVVVENSKTTEVQTGVSMDSIPYVILIAVCAVAAVAFVTKRRRVEF